MKLLLTSGGVTNPSIRNALVTMLGKTIEESAGLCIPTAAYAMSGGTRMAWNLISGHAVSPLCDLGWKSLGVLELTALPSIDRDRWVPVVREADALLVGGGDALYLSHWMRESGLADLLPALDGAVWVGVSGGSMVLTPRIGTAFKEWEPPEGGDSALGVVDFSIFPHVDHPLAPENSMAEAEKWAAEINAPAYILDDQSAISVVDGVVEVISEGRWRLRNA